MTFKEYYDALKLKLSQHPEMKNYTVVYSCDDEGNQFDEVRFKPTIGEYHPDTCEFSTEGKITPNAVCVN